MHCFRYAIRNTALIGSLDPHHCQGKGKARNLSSARSLETTQGERDWSPPSRRESAFLMVALINIPFLAGAAQCVESPSNATLAEEDLEIVEVAEGRGRVAKQGDFVVLNYRGSVESTGDTFDDTFARKKPRAFVLGGRPFSSICGGLMAGVEGMRIGGRRRITVPPRLGFGAKGAKLELPGCSGALCDAMQGGEVVAVPPGATLVYEVELLKVSLPPPGAQ